MYFRMVPFFDIHILQGSVATCLKRDGLFKHEFVANLLPSPLVKKIWKSELVKLWLRVWCLVFWFTVYEQLIWLIGIDYVISPHRQHCAQWYRCGLLLQTLWRSVVRLCVCKVSKVNAVQRFARVMQPGLPATATHMPYGITRHRWQSNPYPSRSCYSI